MNFNNRQLKNSTITMRVVCAIVFCLFSFLFLYCFQAAVMAAAQHVLSEGKTHYSPVVVAVIITFILQLLQIGIFSITKLKKRSHALTYFPSCLLLAFVTDISPNIDQGFSIGAWVWVFPLLIIIYVIIVLFAREFQPYEPDIISQGLFSRWMWVNLLTMALMFFLVGVSSNGNDVFHYRMQAEMCLDKNEYDNVLSIGKSSEKSDASLTMLRIYALSRKGELGDRLFEYPVVGRSSALLPTKGVSKCLLFHSDSIYRYLGAIPKEKLLPMDYLKLIRSRHLMKPCAVDYILCGYLLDRNLDAFVRELPKYYKVDEHLPKYYREALILYTHLRSNPILVFHSSVMDTDYQDMEDLEKQYPDKTVRANNVRDMYGTTYWFYYLYGDK